jgi:predicted RNA binding protein YcfA (HicA-like mRNA interferase family)
MVPAQSASRQVTKNARPAEGGAQGTRSRLGGSASRRYARRSHRPSSAVSKSSLSGPSVVICGSEAHNRARPRSRWPMDCRSTGIEHPPVRRLEAGRNSTSSIGCAGDCSRPDCPRRVASRFGECHIRRCRMSSWPSAKARRVFHALKRIGWRHDRTVGSHKIMKKGGWADYPFSFHDSEEHGPAALAKISKKTGLQPQDL